jgi:hypothetical protein
LNQRQTPKASINFNISIKINDKTANSSQNSSFSLKYCRSIREQILQSFTHRNFSIMVVGAKCDLAKLPNYSQVKVFLYLR